MKKIFTTLFAAAALVFGVQAQTAQNLKIHFADGNVATHSVAAIDSITFADPFFAGITIVDPSQAISNVYVNNTDGYWGYGLTIAANLAAAPLDYLAEWLLDGDMEYWEENKDAIREYYKDPDLTFAEYNFVQGYATAQLGPYNGLTSGTQYVFIVYEIDPETGVIGEIATSEIFTTAGIVTSAPAKAQGGEQQKAEFQPVKFSSTTKFSSLKK